jgi:hypothetical protein
VGVSADRLGTGFIERLEVAAEEQHRDAGGLGIFLQCLADCVTVHVRHGHIDHSHVRFEFLRFRQRLRA